MPELTLEWTENGQQRHTKITDNGPTKHPGTYRIGRHPDLCDLVISHPTVSGLHVEIFYNRGLRKFSLRNLRKSNPPTIDGKLLPEGETLLKMGTIFTLGQVLLKVTRIQSVEFPPTVVVNHTQAQSSPSPQPYSSPNSLPHQTPKASTLSKIPSTGGVYMLRCPSCGRDCPREWMESRVGCRWCGCSLDAGMSVFVPKQK